MIAFDTNHLLRHVLQDDPKQCQHVAALLETQSVEGNSVLILDLVIMETCWVLTKVYGFGTSDWIHVLDALLSDPAFGFEDSPKLRHALELFQLGNADFNDYLILASAEAKSAMLETFDKS